MTHPNEADIRELIAYTIDKCSGDDDETIAFHVTHALLYEARIQSSSLEFLSPEDIPPGVERTIQVTVAGKKMTFDIYEPVAKWRP